MSKHFSRAKVHLSLTSKKRGNFLISVLVRNNPKRYNSVTSGSVSVFLCGDMDVTALIEQEGLLSAVRTNVIHANINITFLLEISCLKSV